MEIKTGTTRRVFIFKNVVIKVARIRILIVLRNSFCMLKLKVQVIRRDGWKNYYLRLKEIEAERPAKKIEYEEHRLASEKEMQLSVPITKRYEQYGTNAMSLFSGIMANWHEWKFYQKTKNPFAMPTYFSLLGLVNIQKKGRQIDFWDDVGVWFYIHENSQNHNQPFSDVHALASLENYCLDDRHLKMVDYGSRYVQPFLEVNGEKLYENFKLPC